MSEVVQSQKKKKKKKKKSGQNRRAEVEAGGEGRAGQSTSKRAQTGLIGGAVIRRECCGKDKDEKELKPTRDV